METKRAIYRSPFFIKILPAKDGENLTGIEGMKEIKQKAENSRQNAEQAFDQLPLSANCFLPSAFWRILCHLF